jgi:hypothetical protein
MTDSVKSIWHPEDVHDARANHLATTHCLIACCRQFAAHGLSVGFGPNREKIVKDVQRNAKITQIVERDAERRIAQKLKSITWIALPSAYCTQKIPLSAHPP